MPRTIGILKRRAKTNPWRKRIANAPREGAQDDARRDGIGPPGGAEL
jgi:hypothetical protein